jgi:hypothetical protein
VFREVSLNCTDPGNIRTPRLFVNIVRGVTSAVTLTHDICVEILNEVLVDAFNAIRKFPTPKVYTGFCNVLNDTAVLFPVTLVKIQVHAAGKFTDVSLNCTARGAAPDVLLYVNEAGVLRIVVE